MTVPRPKTFRERILSPRNRRSTRIEDRRYQNLNAAPLDSAGYGGEIKDVRPDLFQPVRLPRDAARVSEHEAAVARYQAEDALTGEQTDEIAPIKRRKRGLRNVRVVR